MRTVFQTKIRKYETCISLKNFLNEIFFNFMLLIETNEMMIFDLFMHSACRYILLEVFWDILESHLRWFGHMERRVLNSQVIKTE